MGFWDNQLNKSEAKLNTNLISQINAEFPALKVWLGEYPCREQSFLHSSLELAAPIHGVLKFHRCRNVWYAASADGNVDAELGKPPATAAAMALVIWAERLDAQSFLEEKTQEWVEIHELAGAGDGGMVRSILDNKYEELWQVAKGHGGALVQSPFGSSWISGNSPTNRTEQMVFEHLTKNRGLLASQGVSDQDIQTYWDQSGLAKAMQWMELNWLRMGITTALLQGGVWESLDEGIAAAAEKTNRLSPIYMGLTNLTQIEITPSSPLPNELFIRTFIKFKEAFKNGGIRGLERLTAGFNSGNEYVRAALL